MRPAYMVTCIRCSYTASAAYVQTALYLTFDHETANPGHLVDTVKVGRS